MVLPDRDNLPPRLALGVVLALGAALRFWQAGESLWLDELHTAWCALGEWNEVASRAALGNQSPLFFWLQWLLVRLLGASELTVRLPSLVAGSLLPLAIYWVSVRWTHSRWLGVLAAALVAVDRMQIFFATEARPYALIELLAVVHVAIVAELAVRPTLVLRVGIVSGAALLFYLHYTTALLIAAEVLFLVFACFLFRQERSPWRGLGALAVDLAVLALLLMPAIPNLLAIYARRDNWKAFVPQQSVWTIFTLLPWSWMSLVVIGGVVAGRWGEAIWQWRAKRGWESWAASELASGNRVDRPRLPIPPVVLLVVVWLLVPVSLAWLATATDAARLLFPRYVIAAAPAAFVLVAFSLRLVPWRYVQIPAAIGLLAFAIHSSQIIQQLRYDGRVINDRQEDWRGAIAYLNEQLPGNRYPILLDSRLIETEELNISDNPKLRAYCLYPLTSLYPVSADSTNLIVEPPRMPSRNSRIEQLLAAHGPVWVIERSGLGLTFLNKPEVQHAKEFGNIGVCFIGPRLNEQEPDRVR